MKIKILVALIATATIIFLSCNWFRSKKKDVSNPLVGEWKLDSIKQGTTNGFLFVSLNRGMLDTSLVNLSITRDTVVIHLKNEADTLSYSFDEKTNRLITKDSTDPVLTFAKLSDSSITLTTKDSTVLFLQKK